jgi:hypothetical protein
MIGSYFYFLFLPPEIKKVNNIRSNTRIDCLKYNDQCSFIRKLTNFVNTKGQLFFYLSDPAAYILKDLKRLAENSLSNGSHFTGLFIPDLDFPNCAYGDYGNDGLLFLIDWKKLSLEMMVLPNAKNLITLYFQKFIDGEFDEEIDVLRKEAKPFFNYGYL